VIMPNGKFCLKLRNFATPTNLYRVFARTYLGVLDQKWSKTIDSGDWNNVRYRRSGPETTIPTRWSLSIHATGRDNYGGQTVLYPSQRNHRRSKNRYSVGIIAREGFFEVYIINLLLCPHALAVSIVFAALFLQKSRIFLRSILLIYYFIYMG